MTTVINVSFHRPVWVLCILFVALLDLSGCSVLNEGATRVRIADMNNQFTALYTNDLHCNKSIIKNDQAFSVKLVSAYVCRFQEGPGSTNTETGRCVSRGYTGASSIEHKDTGDDGRQTRGEIAIVLNIGERSNDFGLISSRQELNEKGRVVFYSDDVRQSGQLLNFVNIPVYGPRIYTGKPFVIDLAVLELDETPYQLKQLLSSLASAGAKAYPASSGILSLLNNLGTSLMNSKTDDLEMRFQMEFDDSVACSISNVQRMPLREGYYAFIREENRNLLPEWSNVMIDKANGLLVYNDPVEDYSKGRTLLVKQEIWVDTQFTSGSIPKDVSVKTIMLKEPLSAFVMNEKKIHTEVLVPSGTEIEIIDDSTHNITDGKLKVLAGNKVKLVDNAKLRKIYPPNYARKLYDARSWILLRVSRESQDSAKMLDAADKIGILLGDLQRKINGSKEGENKLDPIAEELAKAVKDLK